MKKFFKILSFAFLTCLCLTASACGANKSEKNASARRERETAGEIENAPEIPECPNCPPDCPPNPERPDIPKKPDEGRKQDESDGKSPDENRHLRPARPYPVRRSARVRLMPFEIYIEEVDGERVFYVIFPSYTD